MSNSEVFSEPLSDAEAWALDRVKTFGYEWGVLPSGEVIPFYVAADGHSPMPPISPDSWDWWHWTDTHPQWMECYVVFETWQAFSPFHSTVSEIR